jgi:aryl-alcohol dehydrogenase-like predicted oxidoreductase
VPLARRPLRLERFRTEQPPYSLLVRGIELDVLPTAQRHGMGILTYSPLAGGWLSGGWTADSSPTSPARQRLAARFDITSYGEPVLGPGLRRRSPVAE